MKSLAIAYAGTLITFLIVDAIWLGEGPVALSIVEIAWGTILTAGASGCRYVAVLGPHMVTGLPER